MFEKPYIVLIDVDRRTAENARRLLWRFTALKPKDAVHAASALITKVDALHTFDEALLKLNGRIELLKISRPGLKRPELPL